MGLESPRGSHACMCGYGDHHVKILIPSTITHQTSHLPTETEDIQTDRQTDTAPTVRIPTHH